MFSLANKVPNEINKWIVKRSIKKTDLLEYGKKNFSKCAKFEGSNLKMTVNAENAEITN